MANNLQQASTHTQTQIPQAEECVKTKKSTGEENSALHRSLFSVFPQEDWAAQKQTGGGVARQLVRVAVCVQRPKA